MYRCPREHCGGALERDDDDPEVLRCIACSRPHLLLFGQPVELERQVGAETRRDFEIHKGRRKRWA